MIDHIVLFRLRSEAEPTDVQALMDALSRLSTEVPGVLSYRIERDACLREGNADLGLIARFADAESFSNYLTHPKHVAILDEFGPRLLAEKHSVQFVAPRE